MKCQFFLEGLLPDDTMADDSINNRNTRLRAAAPVVALEVVRVSPDELNKAVKKQKSGKAPGLDGIRAEVVKRTLSRIRPLLLDSLNAMFTIFRFPTAWKQGELKVFLKDKNRDPQELRSYRPVTLLPVLGKIAERIIAERLMQYLDSINFYGDAQFGFRSGRSTIDAVLSVRRKVEASLHRYVLGIFLDISGAFDNAWWPFLMERLHEIHCPGYLLQLLQSYLKERRVIFEFEGARHTKELTKGCPQGSILGPLLWNIIFEDFLTQDFGDDVHVVAYADDAMLVIQGRSRVDLENRAARGLRTVEEWSSRAKLQFSTAKTSAMMLRNRFDRGRRPRIVMNNVIIQCVDEIKYLGLQVEEEMVFTHHVEQQTRKVIETFRGLLSLTRTRGGLECLALRRLYEGIAVPLMTYGCEVWGERAVRQQTLRRMLLKTQRKILLLVNRAYRTVSYDANYVIAGAIPLDLLITERVQVYYDIIAGEQRSISRMRRRTETLNEWQRRWEQGTKGRETFSYLPSVIERMQVNLNTNHYATQFLTGHGNFKFKLESFRLVEDPWCHTCGEGTEETAWHVLAECPAFENERQELVAFWQEHPGEDRKEILCWNPEFFRVFCRVARKVGRTKEGRGIVEQQV